MIKQKPLTGKQLREAIKNKMPVHYTFDPHNPADGVVDWVGILEPAKVDGYFYVGDTDIDIREWEDDEEITWECDGFAVVSSGAQGTAKDQLRERLAAFLHDGVWVPQMQSLMHNLSGSIDLKRARISGASWQQQVLNMSTKYSALTEKKQKPIQDLADKLTKLLEEE